MNINELRDKFGRIGGISIFDTVGTLIGAYLISSYYNYDLKKTVIISFISGEIVHLFLNIETPITKFIL